MCCRFQLLPIYSPDDCMRGRKKDKKVFLFFLTGMLKAGGVSLPRQPKAEVLISVLVYRSRTNMTDRFAYRSILRWLESVQIPGQSGTLDVGSIRHQSAQTSAGCQANV